MKYLKYAFKKEWYNIILLLLPFAALPFIWDDLPAKIATHWNFEGEPDGYSGKFTGLLLVPSLNIVLYLMLLYLPVIDPKKRIEADQKPMPVLRTLMVALFTAIYAFIVGIAMGIPLTVERWLFPALALFFVIMGNYLRTIKPNYFIGIRVPWALEDPENWKKTHKLGSIVWVTGGILLLLLYPLVNFEFYNDVFFAVVMILAIVPMAYSFYLYKFDAKS